MANTILEQNFVFDPLHTDSKGLGSIIVSQKGLRDVKLTAMPGGDAES